MDKDAYALNNAFIKECTQAISMYLGEAKKRSYEVRDEYVYVESVEWQWTMS